LYLLTKILVGAATLVAAVGVAAPAAADPSSFGVLSCSCAETVSADTPSGIAPIQDPIQQGIKAGLTDLHGVRGQQ